MRSRFSAALTCSVRALAGGVLPACLVSCRQSGVLDAQGPVAAAERLLLLNATSIMLVVVGPVILMTLAFAWWFRASNERAAYRPDWTYSGRVELVVWSIPAMIVLLLAGVTWISSHALDPAVPLESKLKPLRIEAVSLDWKWLFIYPDQRVATINQLVVPTGTPIEFVLTSATVMNAFFIPQLGSQIYTMPGMTTRLHLLAEHPGDYPGLSSHYSGDGFSDMRFMVHAVSGPAFDGWLARTQGGARPLTLRGYAALQKPTSNVAATTYGGVEPGLYDHVLQMAAPAGAPQREH